MNAEQYSQYITHTIDGGSGCSDDDEEITFIESEMMRYGTLHENKMDWDGIEKTSLSVLAEKCKSLKILSYLLLALQFKKHGSDFLLSLHLLSIFIHAYWMDCEPQPGEKGLPRKRKMLKQIMLRIEQASEKLRLTDADSELPYQLNRSLDELKLALDTTGFEYHDYDIIKSNCKRQLEVTKAQAPASQTSAPKARVASGQGATTIEETSQELGDIRIDSATERETRQSLFKVASFLCGLDSNEPLGYRLRRYALWHSISSLPPDKEGKTEMMAVPIDRVTEYREQTDRPTPELMDKIEQSLAASPFWMTGNYLAAQAALALDRIEVAQAILEETKKFTKRLPKILQCSFSDGTPFTDDDTMNWLSSSASAGAGQGGAQWNDALEHALKLAKKGDYKQGLSLLEEGMTKATDLREQSYWRLVTADFMSKTGLKTLGQSKYMALSEMVKGMDMSIWEPSFTKNLSSRLPKNQL